MRVTYTRDAASLIGGHGYSTKSQFVRVPWEISSGHVQSSYGTIGGYCRSNPAWQAAYSIVTEIS